MPTYKPITLKMSTAPAYGYTSIKQMDVEGVELILTLKNTDDSDYNLTSGSTLFFKMANESGNVKVTLSEMDSPSNITRDGANVVKVLLTESMVSETGIMACELQEMHSGTFTSSQLFYLRVWPTTEDGEIIDSHEYKSLVSAYLAIDNALNVATLAKNYSESTITEENARQAAELLRIQAENDRVLAESARVAAENLRGVEVANARGDHATLGDRLDEMDVGIEGNASDLENTKLKVIRLEQEVKRYKELYEQSNPTQSPRVSSGGYGVVGLPKNAGQGPMGVSVGGVTRTNILTENQADVEIDTSGFVPSETATLTRDTTTKVFGNASLKVVTPGSTHREGFITDIRPISPLKTYTGSVYLKGSGTLACYLQFFSGTTFLSLTPLRGITLAPDYWQRISLTGVAPENANYIRLTVRTEENTPQAVTFYADGLMIEEGDKLHNWIIGTKSTVSAMRLKSVSADETETSTAYVVAKDEEGKIAELRSLPNGTKDEIRVSEEKLIKRTGEKSNIANGMVIDFADMAEGGTYYAWNNDGETETGVKGDTLGIDATTLIYQLATPIEIPIQTSGSLVSYPSGTVYIEPFVADAGIYTDKMSVLYQDLPIKALEKISKVDFETGVETELDPAQAIIAADKLSFTHPDLEAGDIVFFVYEYDRESTVGETEIEYYDSRYVIKDSVTGKFYKWHIAVAEGVPSIELVEV